MSLSTKKEFLMTCKVLALGAGGMGSVAAKTAALLPEVESLTIADINLDAAQRVAAEIGPKAIGIAVDVNNPKQLSDAIAAHDIVLNATGPFYELGSLVLDCAIEHGVHYANICDDWEPTLAMLSRSEAAQKTGTVAIIGIGCSPGITNMLAVKAARQLDEVDELITGWSIDGAGEEEDEDPNAPPSAAVIHWFQQLTGTIRQLEHGVFGDHKPLVRRVIQYPDFGALPVWSVGHPEAVTLPRTFGTLKHCSNVMVGREEAFYALSGIASLVDDHGVSVRDAAAKLGEVLAGVEQREADDAPPKPSVFAWAKGSSGGKETVVGAQLIAAPTGGMGGITGVPFALVIPFILENAGKTSGVFTAEDIIDPDAFLSALAPYCNDGGVPSDCVTYVSSEIVNA
jgi:saccharopine dehydrogenase-like NADP-dependent oxidoreductase